MAQPYIVSSIYQDISNQYQGEFCTAILTKPVDL